jgi:hypothetical protein
VLFTNFGQISSEITAMPAVHDPLGDPYAPMSTQDPHDD